MAEYKRENYSVEFPFNFYDYSYHNTFSVAPENAGMIVRTYDTVNGITLFHWVKDSEVAEMFIQKNYSNFNKKITDEKSQDILRGTMCYHYDQSPFYVDVQTVKNTREKIIRKLLTDCIEDLRDTPLADGLPHVARLYGKLTENDIKNNTELLEKIRVILQEKNNGHGFSDLKNLIL